jgi:hypothetical protein
MMLERPWQKPQDILVTFQNKTFFDGIMWLQRSKTLCVLVLIVHVRTLENLGHFKIVPTTNYKVCHKEEGGASPQVWAMGISTHCPF